MSAQRPGWFRKLVFKLSFHTDVNEALKRRQEVGIEIGKKKAEIVYHRSCPVHKVPLSEVETGLYCCLLCYPERNTSPIAVYEPGAYTRIVHQQIKAKELTPDTARIAAIRAKNGPAYQQRLTQRLQYQPDEEGKQ